MIFKVFCLHLIVCNLNWADTALCADLNTDEILLAAGIDEISATSSENLTSYIQLHHENYSYLSIFPLIKSNSKNNLEIKPATSHCSLCRDSNRLSNGSFSALRYDFELTVNEYENLKLLILFNHSASESSTFNSDRYAEAMLLIFCQQATEFFNEGEYFNATRGLNISLELLSVLEYHSRSNPNNRLIAYKTYILNNFGAILFKQNKLEMSNEYLLRALDLSRDLSTYAKSIMLYNLGLTAYQNRKFSLAIEYFNSSMNTCFSEVSKDIFLMNDVEARSMMARISAALGMCYYSKNDAINAKKYFGQISELLSGFEDIADPIIVNSTYLLMTRLRDTKFILSTLFPSGYIIASISMQQIKNLTHLSNSLNISYTVDPELVFEKRASGHSADIVYLDQVPDVDELADRTTISALLSAEIMVLAKAEALADRPLRGSIAVFPCSAFKKITIPVPSRTFSDTESAEEEGGPEDDPLHGGNTAVDLPVGSEYYAVWLDGSEDAEVLEAVANVAARDTRLVLIILEVHPLLSLVHTAREVVSSLRGMGVHTPIVHSLNLEGKSRSHTLLRLGAEVGAILVEGLGDGLNLKTTTELFSEAELTLTSSNLLFSSGRRKEVRAKDSSLVTTINENAQLSLTPILLSCANKDVNYYDQLELKSRESVDSEAEAKRVHEERLRLEAEAEARRAREEKLRLEAEAEAKRAREERLRLEAEAEAKRAREEKLRLEAEAEAKRAHEERLRLEAEAEAKRAHEERLLLEAEAEAKRLEEEVRRLEAIRLEEQRALEAAEERRLKFELELKQASEVAEAKRLEEEKRRLAAEEDVRRLNEENARLAAENAKRVKEEEERRLAAEALVEQLNEESKRLKLEAEKNRLLQEEKLRRAAEEEARLLEEEKLRIAAEFEAKRLEEERLRLQAEAEAKKAEEERLRLAAELEAKKVEEERVRLEAEAEARRLEEERVRLAAELEAMRIEEERFRLEAEAEVKRIEEERLRLAAELEAKKIEDERVRLAAEAEAKRVEEEREARLAEERRLRKLQEEEDRRKKEEERKKLLAKEAENKRLAEEKRRLATEAELKRKEKIRLYQRQLAEHKAKKMKYLAEKALERRQRHKLRIAEFLRRSARGYLIFEDFLNLYFPYFFLWLWLLIVIQAFIWIYLIAAIDKIDKKELDPNTTSQSKNKNRLIKNSTSGAGLSSLPPGCGASSNALMSEITSEMCEGELDSSGLGVFLDSDMPADDDDRCISMLLSMSNRPKSHSSSSGAIPIPVPVVSTHPPTVELPTASYEAKGTYSSTTFEYSSPAKSPSGLSTVTRYTSPEKTFRLTSSASTAVAQGQIGSRQEQRGAPQNIVSPSDGSNTSTHSPTSSRADGSSVRSRIQKSKQVDTDEDLRILKELEAETRERRKAERLAFAASAAKRAEKEKARLKALNEVRASKETRFDHFEEARLKAIKEKEKRSISQESTVYSGTADTPMMTSSPVSSTSPAVGVADKQQSSPDRMLIAKQTSSSNDKATDKILRNQLARGVKAELEERQRRREAKENEEKERVRQLEIKANLAALAAKRVESEKARLNALQSARQQRDAKVLEKLVPGSFDDERLLAAAAAAEAAAKKLAEESTVELVNGATIKESSLSNTVVEDADTAVSISSTQISSFTPNKRVSGVIGGRITPTRIPISQSAQSKHVTTSAHSTPSESTTPKPMTFLEKKRAYEQKLASRRKQNSEKRETASITSQSTTDSDYVSSAAETTVEKKDVVATASPPSALKKTITKATAPSHKTTSMAVGADQAASSAKSALTSSSVSVITSESVSAASAHPYDGDVSALSFNTSVTQDSRDESSIVSHEKHVRFVFPDVNPDDRRWHVKSRKTGGARSAFMRFTSKAIRKPVHVGSPPSPHKSPKRILKVTNKALGPPILSPPVYTSDPLTPQSKSDMWSTFSPYKVSPDDDEEVVGGAGTGEKLNKLSREDWTNLVSPKRSRYGDAPDEDRADEQFIAEGGTETDTGCAAGVSNASDGESQIEKNLDAVNTNRNSVSVDKQVTEDITSVQQGSVTTTKKVTTTIITTITSNSIMNGNVITEVKEDVIVNTGTSSESYDSNHNVQQGDTLCGSSSIDSQESINALKEKLASRKKLDRAGLLVLKETLMTEAVKVANSKNSMTNNNNP